MMEKFDFLLGTWNLESNVPRSAFSEADTGPAGDQENVTSRSAHFHQVGAGSDIGFFLFRKDEF